MKRYRWDLTGCWRIWEILELRYKALDFQMTMNMQPILFWYFGAQKVGVCFLQQWPQWLVDVKKLLYFNWGGCNMQICRGQGTIPWHNGTHKNIPSKPPQPVTFLYHSICSTLGTFRKHQVKITVTMMNLFESRLIFFNWNVQKRWELRPQKHTIFKIG